jgi:hypothetical protein
VATARRALTMSPEKDAPAIRARVALYEESLPFRGR